VPGSDFQYEDIAPLIGAVVRLGKAALLSGDHAAQIRALAEARGVVVFPQVQFGDAELVAFTRTLGEYAPDTPDGAPTAISIDPGQGGNADYTRSSLFWHFDGYMNPVPIFGSVLCARALAASGGDTQFANTYAAYEALPGEVKARIAGLRAVHALAAAQRSVQPEPDYATFQRWRAVPSASLPLVWTHASGRKSLVVGNTALAIEGMDPLESLDLLTWLRDFATQPRFTCAHTWRVGDAVLWDNTGTLHRVTPYAPDSGRLMMRTKIAGAEPLG